MSNGILLDNAVAEVFKDELRETDAWREYESCVRVVFEGIDGERTQ